MNEMIMRVRSDLKDAEILVIDYDGKEIWKKVSFAEVENALQMIKPHEMKKSKPIYMPPEVIAYSDGNLIYRMEERRRIVTYKKKAFEINFPRVLIQVEYGPSEKGIVVKEIHMYTFFEWNGLDTFLYRYPMPNMYGNDRLCIGSANRSIEDITVFQAVENILDAEYTHDHVDNMIRQTSTIKWFDYLRTGHCKESDLAKTMIQLKNLVNVL